MELTSSLLCQQAYQALVRCSIAAVISLVNAAIVMINTLLILLTSAIAFPTFLGMAVLSPQLVLLLFGTQWLPPVPVMQVLAFMGIMQSVSYFKGSVFMAMGKPSWRLWLARFG